ncbi:LysR substrate-binding domain-containing protein [Pseudonocardia sp. HH130630-07]|uniref:LysR substrate-binding domain-containing protein n=1 Tax=Pseudonocardia sp. HH130630-07 TaxID=1690815 RepID=UPI000814B6F7|nr:LysR substrate-binding domain-containing protein [Pseudonocardia sp. HH130630-07]ANY09439.1 LysR family transcriptional regulator [Pseudonocardia sp. HH130630-07]
MSEDPDPETLRLLVLVGECGSLGLAAARLGMSQPSASKRMTTLERRLGLRLLDRSRRGSVLTEAGELVGGWAQRVLDEYAALRDGVELLRTRATAALRVAASLTVAEHLLPGWLAGLRRSAPDVRVGLQVTNSTRVCELVRDGGVDVGFIESPQVLPGLRTRTVGHDRLVLVVGPDHPWARRRRPVGPEELARTPLLTREPGSGTRDTAERALAACGTTPVPPLLELGSSAAIRSTAVTGAGPALLSGLVVTDDIAAHRLVEVPTTGIDLERRLRAVWRSAAAPSGDAAALIGQALRSQPAGRPGPAPS